MSDITMTVETVDKVDFLFRPEEAGSTARTAARILAGEVAKRHAAAVVDPSKRRLTELFVALYPTAKLGDTVLIGRDAYLLDKLDWQDGGLRVLGYRRLDGRWSSRHSRVDLASIMIGDDL